MKKGLYGSTNRRKGYVPLLVMGHCFWMRLEICPKTPAQIAAFVGTTRIRPVGSNTIKKFTARVVAATHVDLEAATTDGRFRQDLYYRIAVQEIFIPPLREKSQTSIYCLYILCENSMKFVAKQFKEFNTGTR